MESGLATRDSALHDDAAAALAATPFFAGLSAVELARLVPELEERHCQPDEAVFRQGDPGDGLYVIRSGTAGVRVAAEGEAESDAQIVAALEAPAYFGEMALLSDEPRSATVVALTSLSLWKLPRERFAALVGHHPELALRLAAEVTRRLAETTRKLSASRHEVVAVAVAAFDGLDSASRSLLCRAAVLPELDAELLRDLLGPSWSPDAFERLRRSVFFSPAERPGRLRFAHEPMREFLLEQLAYEIGPEGLDDWRRRVADVLLTRGETNLQVALDLLRDAREWDRLVALLETEGPALAEHVPERLEEYLRVMPEDMLWHRPRLVRLLATACAARGRPDQAIEAYHHAERRDPAARSGALAAEYQEALADLYESMGRHDQAFACLRRAMELRGRHGGLRALAGGAHVPAQLPRGADHEERREHGRLALAGARGLALAAVAAGSRGLGRSHGALAPRRLASLVVLVLTAAAWLLPPLPGLGEAGLRVLVTVLGALALSVLGVLPAYVLALSMIGVWVVTGTLPAPVAAAGFASSTWFLLLASMAIGTAVARSGLLYRGAIELVRRLPPRHVVRCLTLAALGVLFSPGMPVVLGRVSLALPLAQDIADSLRYPARSGGSAGLALATYVGFGMMGTLFLTGSPLCLILYGLFPPDVQARMTWAAWFAAALPTHLVLFGLTMSFLLVRYRPERAEGLRAETLALQRQVLGRLSRDEWSAVAILAGLLVGFSTQSVHGIDPAWLALAAVAALFLTGGLDDGSFRDGINWSFLLYLGVILSFGEIFAFVGLDAWLGEHLEVLTGHTAGDPAAFVLAVAALAAALSVVLQAGPASIVLSLALYPAATAVGVSPWVMAIAILMASSLWLYPQQNVVYLTAYYATQERAFSHAQARPLALVYAAIVFLSLLVSIPYWRWLGLIT